MSEGDSDLIEEEIESIFSLEHRESKKFKDFLAYLSNKEVCLAIVKFLLSLRAAEKKPDEPFEALKDYFGAYNEFKQIPVDELNDKIENIQSQNEYLQQEIEELQEQIQIAREEQERKRREQELLEAEKAKEKGGRRRRRR